MSRRGIGPEPYPLGSPRPAAAPALAGGWAPIAFAAWGAGRVSCCAIASRSSCSGSVVLVLGGLATTRMAPLLSNTFSVPGTDSEHVRTALENHFGDRPDGSFTVVFEVPDARDPALVARLQRVVDRAATSVPTGRGTRLARRRPACDLRRRRLDAEALAGEGPERLAACGDRTTGGRRARLRDGRRVDPARARPDLQPGPAQGRVDRAPDRARRAAARLRALGVGDDPVHLRRAARSPARSGSSTGSRTSPRRRRTSRTSCS